jgi:hypothetical protein
MLRALSDYLEDSGLDDHNEELAQYFAAQPSYELALEARLVSTLSRRGRALLESDRVAALEMFNRVLTLDPENAEVLALIDRLSRQARGRQLGYIVLALVAVAGVVWFGRTLLAGRTGSADRVAASALDAGQPVATAPAAASQGPADAGTAAVETDAGGVALAPTDARTRSVPRAKLIERRAPPPTVDKQPDAGAVVASARTLTLNVYPRNSEYRVDGGTWTPIRGRAATFEVSADAKLIDVRNPGCCESQSAPIAGKPGGTIVTTLGWLPARVTLECSHPGTRTQIDGRGAELGRAVDVPIGDNAIGSRTIEVAFFSEDGKLDKRQLKVSYKETKVVRCAF